MFYKSLVFQVMPTFKSRKSNKVLFSEQYLNKGLDDVLTNGISFRNTFKVHGTPIGTVLCYKKKMRLGNTEVKKLPSHTHAPVKKKIFPQEAVGSESSTNKEEVFVNSESDASLSDHNASLAAHLVELVMFRCGDVITANAHPSAGKYKKFIGKLISGDQDFETSFLRRSK